MKFINVLLSVLVAITSSVSFASSSEKVVITNASELISAYHAKVKSQDVVLEIADTEAFLADLKERKMIRTDLEAQVFENPEALLESIANPTGNAQHRYRRGGYYYANPVWWLAFIIVISTPAYVAY